MNLAKSQLLVNPTDICSESVRSTVYEVAHCTGLRLLISAVVSNIRRPVPQATDKKSTASEMDETSGQHHQNAAAEIDLKFGMS